MFRNLFIKTAIFGAFMASAISSANSVVYAGLSLGGNHMAGSSMLNAHRDNTGAIISQNISNKLCDTNVHGDLFAGYGERVNDVWLALEAHAGLSALETQMLLNVAQIEPKQPLSIRSSHNSGLAFHIGYEVSPNVNGYVKLGAEVRKFETRFDGKNFAGDPVVNHNKKFWSVGFVPGFGIETEFTPKITLRTEYKASIHPVRHFKTKGANVSYTSLKTKPTLHHVSLGLHFKL